MSRIRETNKTKPGTRIFGNWMYHFSARFTNRADADKYATEQRKKGKLARVQRFNFGEYRVYTSPKGGK